jgi:hypothetical protein
VKVRPNRNKFFQSQNQGRETNLTSVRRNGNIYLGYKDSGGWYYTKLSKNMLSLTEDSPKEKSIDKLESLSIYPNNSKKESPVLGYTAELSEHGSLFNIGRFPQKYIPISHRYSQNFSVIQTSMEETGGTRASASVARVNNIYYESLSAGVTITSASSLSLGLPQAGDNVTITNAYSLELEGNIKSNGLIIDDAGDITLDAAGADINFDVGGTNRLNWNGVTGLTMKSLVDLDDYFNISTTLEHGVTIFATHDDSGANGGHMQFQPQGDIKLQAVTGKVSLDATDKLYFDGGSDTYIYENTADNLKFVVGNDAIMTLVENASSGNLVNIGTSCAGFNQHEPTYNATDTNVLFMTLGNKAFLTFGSGSITDLNLYFPDTSCNCLLVIKQDGTGSRTVTNWKTFDQDTGNESTVAWPGGSAPTLSTGANAVDIISFYWDNDNHKAYGVASLNFSSP